MTQRALRLSLLATLLVLASAPASRAADTVYLQDGRAVEGKIEQVREDDLRIRTATGPVTYTRDEVKYFSIDQTGADGKTVAVQMTFKPKPIQMPFTHESEHYVVKSDTAKYVCENAGKAMDQLYVAYMDIFHLKAPPSAKKAEIVIFDKKEDLQKYAKSTGTELREDTLGFFRQQSDGSSLIVVYKRRGEFDTLSTLYHEATHQFVTGLMGMDNLPPLWLNEGLAVYFETSEWQGARLRTGVIPRSRLLLLQQAIRQDTCIRLADLMKRGRENFDGLCYSESWALVYFLVRSNNGAYARNFSRYFDMLKDKKDPDAAFKECFTGDLDKLETAWKRYVLQLKAPRK